MIRIKYDKRKKKFRVFRKYDKHEVLNLALHCKYFETMMELFPNSLIKTSYKKGRYITETWYND